MSAVVVKALERELALRDWQKHMSQRPETDLGVEAAKLLGRERSLR